MSDTWKTMDSAPKNGTEILCIWGFDPDGKPLVSIMSYRRRFDDRIDWFEKYCDLKKTPKFWTEIPEFKHERN